jgi:hypothetical protein
MKRSITHALATAIFAGCATDSITEPGAFGVGDAMPHETAITAPRLSLSPELVVATVALPNGGNVDFVDLGDGNIAVGERAPRNARFVAIPQLAIYGATALEVFQAARPLSPAPAALVRDHERRRKMSAPRNVQLPNELDLVSRDLKDPGSESYLCHFFGDEWLADWDSSFVGVTKYRAAAYPHFQTGTITFYPGAPVYYGTNTNSITYLGACNGDDVDDLTFEIHRRISGSWTPILSVLIGFSEKYTFYSPIPASYRGRTYGADRATIEHYGIGAAWTLSPRKATP